MPLNTFFDRIELIFYKYGLFSSRHPISMICFSAVMILSCCYPLINLPIPGSEPQQFSSLLNDLEDIVNVDNASRDIYKDSPKWFSMNNQTAFIQQFVIKVSIDPLATKDFSQRHAFKASLDYVFPLLEEIQTFSVDEHASIVSDCFPVSHTVIKTKQKIKSMFPEEGCLLLSPAAYWKNQHDMFTSDANIQKTIDQYDRKAIKAPPSMKELLFGLPLDQTIPTMKPFVVSFAITLVLKRYNGKLIQGLKQRLQGLYSPADTGYHHKNCVIKVHSKAGTSCASLLQTVTHIRYYPEMCFNDLIPLLSSYFVMGCYIYFSVKKINFVKSKLGMALCAVVSVLASLMMAVGLCSLIGLTPALTGGQTFPYLVCFIGLENILVITKSVVATHTHLDVDKRVAVGLSREGSSIVRNLLLEFFIVGLGFFNIFVPEIKEFCAFAVIGICSDFLINMMFFVPVLSIDIRRLDLTEDPYPDDSTSDESDPVYPYLSNNVKKRNQTSRKRPASKHKRVNSIEIGGKAQSLRIPRRLRLVFFFADTRMIQRGLMVFMVLWFSFLLYRDPAGILAHQQSDVWDQKCQVNVNFDAIHAADKLNADRKDNTNTIKWTSKDILSYHYLSFRHWPTLFSYYNVTLAERYVSVLPPILVPIKLTQSNIDKFQKNQEGKSGSHFYMENLNFHLPSNFYTGRYQMTGFDYYLTLIIGAVSGILMLLLLNFMYHCICSRNYANWRTPKTKAALNSSYATSTSDSVPLLLSGHSQMIDCVHVEGTTITSADISGELRTWDSHSGECTGIITRKLLTKESNRINNSYPSSGSINKTEMLSPSVWSLVTSGQFIFVGCANGQLEVWDIVSGNIQCKHVSSKGGIVGLACEESRVVVARISGTLDFFLLEDTCFEQRCSSNSKGSPSDLLRESASDINLQLIHTVKCAHRQPISAFVMCMQRVLTGSCDHTIKLFSFQDAKCQFSMFGHTGPITALYIEKQSSLGAVSGSTDATVRLWDLLSGTCIHKLEGHGAAITSAQCSMYHVVSTAQDDEMCIWERRTGRLLQTKHLNSNGCGAMSLFGQNLCVTGGKGDLLLWDIRNGDLLRRVPISSGSVVQPTVDQVHVSTGFCIVCVIGHGLLVVRFPAVLEKN